MDLKLKASDGHEFSAYLAEPSGTPRGGVVVIQEIFGVNSHIRSVADDYAKEGYVALAPALFDRVGPGIELGYEADDVAKGLEIRGQVANEAALKDLTASISALRARGLNIGVVGYCWGGSLTWEVACWIDGVAAASSYYGGDVPKRADESTRCPAILHFGETDASIPMESVNAFIGRQRKLPVHVYAAGHGFNCDQRGSYDADSAKLAKERTLALFAEHVG